MSEKEKRVPIYYKSNIYHKEIAFDEAHVHLGPFALIYDWYWHRLVLELGRRYFH